MKTKKMILILILIFSLSFILTGCSAIGELKTETIVANYLKSEEGPESVVKQSFNKLFAEISSEESLSNYTWEYSVNLDKVNIVDAKSDSDGSGILTANNIVLVYNYTITGESDLESISKNGKLSYNISQLRYDDNKEELLKMTATQAERQTNSPIISDFKPDYSDGFSFTTTIENNTADSLGVFSLGDRSLPDPDRVLEISGNQLILNTNLTLNETNFASILVINYDELLDRNSAQTGIASMLIAVP